MLDGPEPDDDLLTEDADRDAALTVHVDDETGDVTISLPGQGDPDDDPDDGVSAHDRNLALRIEDEELNVLADDLLRLIDLDDQSRASWIDRRVREIDLLGIDPETPSPNSGSGNVSRVSHPLLLDAVLRFQANARGELLPVDGPAKVRVDHADDPTAMAPNGMAPDDLAEAFEADINCYLTETATEYVPSTDKMLFGLGLSGMGFKKVYHCPLRRRPVSEAVTALDIIVSNDIEDIRNASRVTHVIRMRAATVRRMQLAGAYRDVDLVDPGIEAENAVEDRIDAANGVSEVTFTAEDRERTIYECYCELDLPGYEHEEDGKVTGLPLPYKVVVDKSDRVVLEIRRNWIEGDATHQARQVIVPWQFVPWHGGFWSLGLGAIMGGATQAATAGWRIMLDTGMQNAFPGGFVDKAFLRGQDTQSFRIAPGDYVPVETGSNRLGDVVMPLPQRSIDAAFMQLVESFVDTGQKLGGAAEIGVGEGKQDAPVGTTIALIEQAQKVMDAVHKRLCQAQGRELELLADLFREDPEAFWRSNTRPATQWDRDTLLYCLDAFGLQPVADPNTSSHMQRVMAAQGLLNVATTAPMYFDGVEVIKHYLKTIRIPNPERFIAPNAPPPGSTPPPKGGRGAGPAASDPSKMAKVQIDAGRLQLDKQKADADAQRDQAQTGLDAKRVGLEAQGQAHQQQLDAAKLRADASDPSKVAGAQADLMNARTDAMDAQNRAREIAVDQQNNEMDANSQAAQRATDLQMERERLAVDAGKHATDLAQADRHHGAELDQADRHHAVDTAEGVKDRKAARSKPGGLGGVK